MNSTDSQRVNVVQQPFKRAMDLVLTVPAAILLFPVLVAVAMFVRLSMGKPVLFRQLRAGRGGQPMMLLKFRTMSDAKNAAGKLLPDNERLTKFGRFLRTTSLDELPQFWNLLRGELSIVGPRPLLMEYLPLYSPEQARRLAVLPGVTSLPAIKGRNTLSWDQKFALDTWYVDHWSLGLDLRIFFVTIWCVLRREGISHPGHATMPKFSDEHLGSRCPEKTL